ncbi:SecY subunit domain-containing protein [Flammula alnicola]|nr:SecY subunit domain-containing protein [Flammula alnicola]
MSGFRFLSLVRPFYPFCLKSLHFNQKVLWTAVALLIFLVCSQAPLYDIMSSDSSDPLYWMRVILASNCGTLMELGFTPIVTSRMITQLLAGANLIDVDFGLQEDWVLFSGAQKLFALIILLGQATDLGAGACLLLIIQLIHQLATNICESVMWKVFSPTTVNIDCGSEFEGAIVALFHLLFTWLDKGRALREALFSTVVIFAIVIYLQGFRIEIPVKSNRFRGQRRSYPVKLFYTSNMPVILQSALRSNNFIVSQMLATHFPSNLFVKILGPLEDSPQLHATSGIMYYMSPLHTIREAVLDPIHTAMYITFILSAGALFSKTWIEVSGSGLRHMITGHREGSIGTGVLMAVTIIYSYWEIGMRESGGPEMAAFGDLL